MYDFYYQRLLNDATMFKPREGTRYLEIWDPGDGSPVQCEEGSLLEADIPTWLNKDTSHPVNARKNDEHPARLRLLIGSPEIHENDAKILPLPYSTETFERIRRAWDMPTELLRMMLSTLPISTVTAVQVKNSSTSDITQEPTNTLPDRKSSPVEVRRPRSRRSRGRHNSRSSQADDVQNSNHRNKDMAKAGVAGAVFADLIQKQRSKVSVELVSLISREKKAENETGSTVRDDRRAPRSSSSSRSRGTGRSADASHDGPRGAGMSDPGLKGHGEVNVHDNNEGTNCHGQPLPSDDNDHHQAQTQHLSLQTEAHSDRRHAMLRLTTEDEVAAEAAKQQADASAAGIDGPSTRRRRKSSFSSTSDGELLGTKRRCRRGEQVEAQQQAKAAAATGYPPPPILEKTQIPTAPLPIPGRAPSANTSPGTETSGATEYANNRKRLRAERAQAWLAREGRGGKIRRSRDRSVSDRISNDDAGGRRRRQKRTRHRGSSRLWSSSSDDSCQRREMQKRTSSITPDSSAIDLHTANTPVNNIRSTGVSTGNVTTDDVKLLLMIRGGRSRDWNYCLGLIYGMNTGMTCALLQGLEEHEIGLLINCLKSSRQHVRHPMLLPLFLTELKVHFFAVLLEKRASDLEKIEYETGMKHGFSEDPRRNPALNAAHRMHDLSKLDFGPITQKLTGLTGTLGFCDLTFEASRKTLELIIATAKYIAHQGVQDEFLNLFMDCNKNEYEEGQAMSAELNTRASYLKGLIAGAQAHRLVLLERTKAQVQTVYSMIGQRDNRLNIETAAASRKIAEASLADSAAMMHIAEDSRQVALYSRRDSTDMRIIAAMTLVFLPGTFAATLFSSSFFNFQVQGTSKVVS